MSVQAITDLVNRANGYEVTTMSVRYQLLDKALNSIGANDDISAYVEPNAKIEHNTGNSVHRSLSLTYHENNAVDFNTLHHNVKVYLRWHKPDKSLLLEVPVGVFTVILPDRNVQKRGTVWTLQMLDLTAIISQCAFLNTYGIAQGSSYVSLVGSILSASDLPASYTGYTGPSAGITPAGLDFASAGIPLSRLQLIPHSTILTPTSLLANPGDNVLAFCDSLLKGANFYDLWADEVGNIRTSPIPYYAGQNPGTSWSYSNDAASSTIKGYVQQKLSQATSDLANVVKILSNNNGTSPISSQRMNLSPNSAISIPNWGRAVTKVIQDDKIPDQASCDFRCYVELQKAATLAEQVTLTTAINPFFQDHDFIALNITDSDGNTKIGTGAYGWEVSDFAWDLATFEQTITAGKLVAL
jgi:hypothetical protein